MFVKIYKPNENGNNTDKYKIEFHMWDNEIIEGYVNTKEEVTKKIAEMSNELNI